MTNRKTNKKRTKKYQKEYETFIKEQHICQCGCGTVLQPSYKAFYTAIKDHGTFPKYAFGHHPRKQITNTKKEYPSGTVEYNGCRIMLLGRSNRCRKSYQCKNYLDCLDYIIKTGALGWKTV